MANVSLSMKKARLEMSGHVSTEEAYEDLVLHTCRVFEQLGYGPHDPEQKPE